MSRTQDDIDLDRLDPIVPTVRADENPFAIVDSPWGFIESWRANALAGGAMSALAQVHAIVRNDADEAVKRVAETEARKALVQNLCDRVATQHNRGIALADELEDLRQQNAELRADNAGLKERIAELEEPISEPPSSSPAVADETHQPGGELHALTAVQDPEPLDLDKPDASELPAPPLDIETDAGGVPLSYGNVPTSYIRGGPKDQAGDLPKELELPGPPEPEHKGKVFPQPVSISLNER